MDYNKIYNDLIQKRIDHPLERKGDASIEEHHIIPRSFGGTNDKSNLVNLTLREHFVAHLLLWQMNKNDYVKCGKMISALFFMMKRAHKLSSRLYEKLRVMGGSWNGRHHSIEGREKIRMSMTPFESSNPRVWVCKNGMVKYILKEKLNDFLQKGWIKGRVGYKPRKNKQGTIIEDGITKAFYKTCEGRVYIHNETLKQTKRVIKDDVSEFQSKGWELGRKIYHK